MSCISDLLKLVTDKLTSAGWQIRLEESSLVAEKTVIHSKWLLGHRKVMHRIAIKLDAVKRELVLEETATESCVGIPPPSFIRTRWTQHGTEYSEDRVYQGWGVSSFQYGQARQLIGDICLREGWAICLRVGTTA